MQTDQRASIADHFAAFDEPAFVDWLSVGLRAVYRNSKAASLNAGETFSERSALHGTVPFDFAHALFEERPESILDGLEYIYEFHIPDSKKVVFRRAVGRLLRQCVGDPRFPEEAISDLIYTIGRVRAHESVECLAPIVGRGRIGQTKPWLQYEAIAVLKGLMPAKEAIACLRQLVTLPNFYRGYSFDVLKTLCRADPGNWLKSFSLMRGHIAKLHAQAKEIGEVATHEVERAAHNFAESFAQFMSTDILGEQLSGIEIAPQMERRFESGMWLVKELIIGDKAPIVHVDAELSFVGGSKHKLLVPIAVASDRSRKGVVQWNSADYTALRRLSRTVQKRKYTESPFFRSYNTKFSNIVSFMGSETNVLE